MSSGPGGADTASDPMLWFFAGTSGLYAMVGQHGEALTLLVAILPLLGVGGMQLMQAEIPGLAPDRLRPRVRQTAALLWVVYALLTAAEVVFLLFGGMSAFEAVNHSFATLATGGFSTEDASLGRSTPRICTTSSRSFASWRA